MWAKILDIEPMDMYRFIEKGLGYSYFKDLSPLGAFSKQDYLIHPEEETENYRVGNTQMFSVFNYGFDSIEWTMAELNTKDDNNEYHPINAKTADISKHKKLMIYLQNNTRKSLARVMWLKSSEYEHWATTILWSK